MSRIRLICPNCGAQYEVPLEVIPEAGRDVQCSSCQHTWFQYHPDHEPEPEPEPVAPPVPDPDPLPEAAPPQPAPPTPPLPPRRELDPSVTEVFREELAYESRRREEEAGSLETQTEFGLEPPETDVAERRMAEAQAHKDAMRPPPVPEPSPEPAPEPDPVSDPVVPAAPVPRRSRLPDVEEVSETLRSSDRAPRAVDSAERRSLDDVASAPARSGGGFARGFFLMILLAALGLAVYTSAPQISDSVPALSAALDSYVATVDQGRGWLDGQVAELLQMLDGMSAEAAQSGG